VFDPVGKCVTIHHAAFPDQSAIWISNMAGELTDAMKKAAKEKLKQYLEKEMGENSKGINFMLEMFDAAIDLVRDSAKNKGMPTKGDLVRYFANKASGFGVLSTQNKVACVSSIISFTSDASKYEMTGAGPVGLATYLAFLVYDGLDTFENCDLAYLDYKIDQDIAKLEETLKHKRAMKHANAILEIQANRSLDASLNGIMEVQCRSIPNSTLP
jgi:hypothetical protein